MASNEYVKNQRRKRKTYSRPYFEFCIKCEKVEEFNPLHKCKKCGTPKNIRGQQNAKS